MQPVKIMVTYDSYPRIANLLDEDLDEYHIVVDEYQELLDACVYRNAAIKNLLRELKSKKNTTFMSATPIPYTYVPEELEDLETYEINWPDAVKVIPHRLGTDKPLGAVVNMIQNHILGRPFELGGDKVDEYFFFVNTVKGIKRIISKAKLRPEDVKVVCGKSELNRLKLGNIEISDVTAPNKTFNFCTKTVFYGADFYSNSGLIVIVSDGYIKSTLLDISTDIQQIAGRIRNLDNPFRKIILHIYSSKNDQLLSESEFDEWIKQRIDYAQTSVDAYESLHKDQKRAITGRIRVDDPDELAYYD